MRAQLREVHDDSDLKLLQGAQVCFRINAPGTPQDRMAVQSCSRQLRDVPWATKSSVAALHVAESMQNPWCAPLAILRTSLMMARETGTAPDRTMFELREQVVGMTTTGVAMHQQLIAALAPKVISL